MSSFGWAVSPPGSTSAGASFPACPAAGQLTHDRLTVKQAASSTVASHRKPLRLRALA